MRVCRCPSPASLLCAVALLWFTTGPALSAPAHDHGSHPPPAAQPAAPAPEQAPAAPHAGHGAAMSGFLKTVPEEYRVMERSPVGDSQESLLSGRKLFKLHCAGCHGSLGRGDGPAAAGLKHPPADFLDFEHSAHYGPGAKYWLIARGNPSVGMPAHPQLSPREVWDLVNYILALQAKARAEGYDRAPHKH